MRIGELARRAGLTVSRIRFYEGRGLLPRVPREGNGYRSYGEDALATLRFIDQAQRLGFSLAEIRDAAPDPSGAAPLSSAIVEVLRRKTQEIDRLIDAATEKKLAIMALLEELDCVP